MPAQNKVLLSYDWNSPVFKERYKSIVNDFIRIFDTLLERLFDVYQGIEELDKEKVSFIQPDNYYAIVFLYFNESEVSDEWENFKSKVIEEIPNESKVIKVYLSGVPSSEDRKLDVRRFYFNLPSEIENDFFSSGAVHKIWPKLLDLAYMIYFAHKEQNIQGHSPTVFLAETSEDQQANRDIIRRELIHNGYTVFPDIKLPLNKKDLLKILEEYLSFVDISIHIFGEKYGDIVEEENTSIVEYQNKIAADFAEKRKDSFFRYIWISPDLKLNDEKQKARIERLKFSTDLLKGAELVLSPVEYLKTYVKRRILDSSILSGIEKQAFSKDKKLLYIICSEEIYQQHMNLWGKIKNENIEVLFPDFSIQSEKPLQSHKDKLIQCDAAVIIAENENVLWLHSKVKDLIKAPGLGRRKKDFIKAVISNDIDKKLIEYFNKNDIKYLDNQTIESGVNKIVSQIK